MADFDEEVPALVDASALHPSSSSEYVKPVPVTILTGFLGSGKSTLLNYILRENHGKRIAVIENELSEGLGIESMLVKSGVDGANLAGFFELSNGCICCQVKDDLIATLEQLVLHKDKFDYVMIETTGVANPGPVIGSFWMDEELGAKLQLDGVITMVDSVNLHTCLTTPESSEETRLQIAYADKIIVNKCDVFKGDMSQVLHEVKAINAAAEVLQTSFARVDLNKILDIQAYAAKPQAVLDIPVGHVVDQAQVQAPCACGADHGHDHDHAHDHDHGQEHASEAVHPAVGKMRTHAFRFQGQVDPLELQRFVGSLLWDRPEGTSIYRMKGVFRCVGSPKLFVLQSVHELLDLQESTYDAEEASENKLVVIGSALDLALIQQGLESCVRSQPTAS